MKIGSKVLENIFSFLFWYFLLLVFYRNETSFPCSWKKPRKTKLVQKQLFTYIINIIQKQFFKKMYIHLLYMYILHFWWYHHKYLDTTKMVSDTIWYQFWYRFDTKISNFRVLVSVVSMNHIQNIITAIIITTKILSLLL